jgi:hypothetical protein
LLTSSKPARHLPVDIPCRKTRKNIGAHRIDGAMIQINQLQAVGGASGEGRYKDAENQKWLSP